MCLPSLQWSTVQVLTDIITAICLNRWESKVISTPSEGHLSLDLVYLSSYYISVSVTARNSEISTRSEVLLISWMLDWCTPSCQFLRNPEETEIRQRLHEHDSPSMDQTVLDLIWSGTAAPSHITCSAWHSVTESYPDLALRSSIIGYINTPFGSEFLMGALSYYLNRLRPFRNFPRFGDFCRQG